MAYVSRILLGAFAEVGITALVDEATGYQKEKDEYQKILERYIAKELQPWLKVFGEDYYYQIYRLKGWDWNRFAVDRKNHPFAVGNITNRIVYEKLHLASRDKYHPLAYVLLLGLSLTPVFNVPDHIPDVSKMVPTEALKSPSDLSLNSRICVRLGTCFGHRGV